LTGLGHSQGDFSHTSFSTNQADLLAAARFLTHRLSAPSFLVGHSFGGACSLSLTEQMDSVRGVVALASPSDTTHLGDFLERLDPQIGSKGVGMVTIGGRDYVIRQQMLVDFRSHDLPAIVRHITKPALLFHSPDDETLGYEHALRLFGLLTQRGVYDAEPAPTSLITLPGADHLLVRHAADLPFVTATIAAWFDRVLRG
jgi:putative redox protein